MIPHHLKMCLSLSYHANYYLMFHAFAAAIIEITSLRPAYILSAMNIIAVFSSLLWIGKTLVGLKLIKPRTLHLRLLGTCLSFVRSMLLAS